MRRRATAGRICARALCVALLALSPATGLLAGCTPGGASQPSSASASVPVASLSSDPHEADPLPVDPVPVDPVPQAVARAVIADRDEAWRTGTCATWVARLADPASGFARAEAHACLVQHQLGTVIGASAITLEATPEATPDPEGWVRVVTRYRIPGVDRAESTHERSYRLVRTGAEWRVTDRRSPAADAGWAVWEIPDARVVRVRSVVLVTDASTATVAQLTADAGTAVARVREVWRTSGAPWELTPLVVLAQSGPVGADGGTEPAAVAATVGEVAAGRPIGADRVVLRPSAWATLSAAGRRVILTHEFAHLAMRATSSHAAAGTTAHPAAPLWAEEGFAQLVAYSSEGLSPGRIAPSTLVVRPGDGRLVRLPGQAAMSRGSDEERQGAYVLAWIAMREISAQAGVRGARRVAVGGSAPHAVAGVSAAQFVSAWRARALRELAP